MGIAHLPEQKTAQTAEKFPYPGIPGTTDGAGMVVHVETNVAEAGIAYPITPSTAMGVGFESAYANGKKNVWGTTLAWVQPESEHSSASAAEGYVVAGGRVTGKAGRFNVGGLAIRKLLWA